MIPNKFITLYLIYGMASLAHRSTVMVYFRSQAMFAVTTLFGGIVLYHQGHGMSSGMVGPEQFVSKCDKLLL